MLIRAASNADQPALLGVVHAAFGEEHGEEVAAMVSALNQSAATRASLVAVIDDRVVGHVQLSRGWIDARRALVEALVLSPL